MKRSSLVRLKIKNSLRIKLKKKRLALKLLILKRKNRAITKKLFSLEEFQKAKSILFYVSFNNEVSTFKMIAKALRQKKLVYVPITDIKNKRLTISRIRVFPGNLARSSYGILEPKLKYRELFYGKKIDIIIVPGLGFDILGNRLGYGGGFYDRLLKKMGGLKIGLAFDFQVLRCIPADNNDQKLDLIITDKRKIRA